jgi:putative transposase
VISGIDVRESLDIAIDTSIPGGRVFRTLDQLLEWCGKPEVIRVDNGPEYLSQVFTDWYDEHKATLNYILPGKPNQNAYIERFMN